MTRKYYIALAKRFMDVYSDSLDGEYVKQEMIKAVCDVLRDENPAFNAAKFRDACGLEVTE